MDLNIEMLKQILINESIKEGRTNEFAIFMFEDIPYNYLSQTVFTF